jgi:hypothetical protein
MMIEGDSHRGWLWTCGCPLLSITLWTFQWSIHQSNQPSLATSSSTPELGFVRAKANQSKKASPQKRWYWALLNGWWTSCHYQNLVPLPIYIYVTVSSVGCSCRMWCQGTATQVFGEVKFQISSLYLLKICTIRPVLSMSE